MWDGAVTPVLESLLVTRKDISRPVGAGKLTNEMVGRSQIGAAPQFARAGEELRTSGGLKLVWTNLNQPAARFVASSLKLVE